MIEQWGALTVETYTLIGPWIPVAIIVGLLWAWIKCRARWP